MFIRNAREKWGGGVPSISYCKSTTDLRHMSRQTLMKSGVGEPTTIRRPPNDTRRVAVDADRRHWVQRSISNDLRVSVIRVANRTRQATGPGATVSVAPDSESNGSEITSSSNQTVDTGHRVCIWMAHAR